LGEAWHRCRQGQHDENGNRDALSLASFHDTPPGLTRPEDRPWQLYRAARGFAEAPRAAPGPFPGASVLIRQSRSATAPPGRGAWGAWRARSRPPISTNQHDLAAGAARLEVAVGVGGGGERIAPADVRLQDAVAQGGEDVAGHRPQRLLGVVEEHRLGQRPG